MVGILPELLELGTLSNNLSQAFDQVLAVSFEDLAQRIDSI
ncbi:hypothetical protein [Methylobacterium radiotolerans]|nr:hypothetical protein [Methylobacterium radiotolerans]